MKVKSWVCKDMDRISGLSDDLLVKILSFLPTKVAVSTSVLSKRWDCLWMWLPKLEFISLHCSQSQCETLRGFLERNLPLHRAPAIESFRLNIADSHFNPEDIKMWVLVAVSRYLCDLEITYGAYPFKPNILPSSLYSCQSLVALKLDGKILLDVPRMVSLSSLKTLQLRQVEYSDEESLMRLLSICPLLENLLLDFREVVKMGIIIVMVPSLQSLSIYIPYDGSFEGLVIDTPSLKYFKLEDNIAEPHSCLVENMPKLVEAYVDVIFTDIESLFGSISSVKRLTLYSEAVYVGEFVFDKLEYLKQCICTDYASNLLVKLLQGSPNLRELVLFEMDNKYGDMVCWNQPSIVPECIVSSLQTFEWLGYLGRPLERDIAVYILKNACCLKTATITSDDSYIQPLQMIKELSLSSRASTSCQLIFIEES